MRKINPLTILVILPFIVALLDNNIYILCVTLLSTIVYFAWLNGIRVEEIQELQESLDRNNETVKKMVGSIKVTNDNIKSLSKKVIEGTNKIEEVRKKVRQTATTIKPADLLGERLEGIYALHNPNKKIPTHREEKS